MIYHHITIYFFIKKIDYSLFKVSFNDLYSFKIQI